MKYTEILTANKKLENTVEGPVLRIRILSNIIVNQVKEILEFELRSDGINAHVDFGNYDNIIQDANSLDNDHQVVLFFFELCNITDGFEYRAEIMDDVSLQSLLERVKSEIDISIKALDKMPLVLFNKFSSLAFSVNQLGSTKMDHMAEALNQHLGALGLQNLKLVDISKIIASSSVSTAIDMRNYYSSKALYTIDFFSAYASNIIHYIRPLSGKIKKVLIMDCDNTLWKGVIGEDGIDGIKMNSGTLAGKPFEAVQNMVLKLAQEGVLIGLCSKNNPQDVDEVLENHPDMILRNEFITIKKVNWENKAKNIKEISKTLNLGLDSFVFVDDSEFELGLLNQELPEVLTFKVNPKSHLYPGEFARLTNRFFLMNRTAEDFKKLEMYKVQTQRDAYKQDFDSIQQYLDSLDIEIDILKNEEKIVTRMSQMTQKTNQFNLTTKRYSESEILNFLQADKVNLYTIAVRDKFGDSGVTGLAVVKDIDTEACIDTFLLSCRIIGRGIEDAFIQYILTDIPAERIRATYIPTKKNDQVRNFFEKFGFKVEGENKEEKNYSLLKENFVAQDITHIKIYNGRET